MDRPARRLWWIAPIVPALLLLPAWRPRDAGADRLPPDAGETLARIGRRLSKSLSVQELSALARRGDRLLAVLTARERSDLGRGTLRFRVDRPVVVEVVAPGPSIPFWLADRGFTREPDTLSIAGDDWPVFSRRFPAGWIGLGVNGLDRSPLAHYAVFVRSDPETESESEQDPPGPSPAPHVQDPEHWRVVPARTGTSAAFDHFLPIAALPMRLQGALLIQPAHDRRHAAMLARGRVWKTHAASGPRPDQVAIAFGDDPARSLVWTWRTDPTVPAGKLRLARAQQGDSDPQPSSPITIIPATAETIATPDLLNDPTIHRHRAVASGLEPDSAYVYSLGDGNPEHWSPWKAVRTGPTRSRQQSFRFLSMGDPQCGLEDWGRLLAAARRRHPDAAFLLIAGDLVDRGNERTNWDHFFLRAAGVFETLPVMPCAGNHEYLDQGPCLFRAFFELPRNGPPGLDSDLVYSFEYGNAFIAVLDSTLAVADDGVARTQAEWLDDALSRTRADWKLVMFHHPVYASHPTRETPALLTTWGPIFDRRHVDLVLQGHDHAYLRTHPLLAGRRVANPAEGTTYVVSVSGTKYCDQRPRDETAVGFTHRSTYQTIDIQAPEHRLIYRAWDEQGRVLDTLTIDKVGG